jgi:hypothetical protein
MRFLCIKVSRFQDFKVSCFRGFKVSVFRGIEKLGNRFKVMRFRFQKTKF